MKRIEKLSAVRFAGDQATTMGGFPFAVMSGGIVLQSFKDVKDMLYWAYQRELHFTSDVHVFGKDGAQVHLEGVYFEKPVSPDVLQSLKGIKTRVIIDGLQVDAVITHSDDGRAIVNYFLPADWQQITGTDFTEQA
jgi:hypothetical protein